MNPIKQDVKKGKIRFVRNCFPHHGYIWVSKIVICWLTMSLSKKWKFLSLLHISLHTFY